MQFIYYLPFLYGLNYLYWFLAGSSQGISLVDFDSSAPASSELETTGGASGVNDLSQSLAGLFSYVAQPAQAPGAVSTAAAATENT